MIDLKVKRILPFALAVAMLICVVSVSSLNKAGAPTSAIHNTILPDEDTNSATADTLQSVNHDEMRGVWVTYMDLSMVNEADKSEKRFREKFAEIAENSRSFGFNTLIVQVRPFCDALYNSKYFPYSHILTGEQGNDPGYDPLEIMCEICKSYDLKIHAWLNPYRVKVKDTPYELCDENPYIKDNGIGFETDGGIYLDPSSKDTQDLITDGVAEIVENYDVDGIQFDDYFYPPDLSDADSDSYNAYVSEMGGKSCMGINNWRKANVNMLICRVYRTVHEISDDVVFGISPQGNIDNNAGLYADVQSWCTCKGFVDYICPQIYFSLDNPKLTFEDALKGWEELEFSDKVTLYVGLAGYKAGSDSDEETWLESDDILEKEYEIIKDDKRVKGFMLYAYASLSDENTQKEIDNLKKALN